ncbi:hypothetical protein ACFQ21_00065 [Ohtaekwangia kribbensis]|uniref:Right handed beta helix region n=1 Tax=Ohtaekwangia kribbensis TaxID=688913 RepID=A0ABW3JVT2_9BACT
MATTYFWNKGFTIEGPNKTAYNPGPIQFNLNYLEAQVSQYGTVKWTFTNSKTGDELKTVLSQSPSVDFTYEEGKDGVDVLLEIRVGTHLIPFFKESRFFITQDLSEADHVINMSLGSADPLIDDLTNGQQEVNAGAIAPGSVIYLSGNLSTARIRFRNVVGTAENPIWITIDDTDNIYTLDKSGTSYDDVFQFTDNCRHVRLVGKKRADSTYRLRFVDGGISSQQFLGAAESHHDIRVQDVEVENPQSSGIKLKLDTVNRFTGAFDDCMVIGNYIHGAGNECIYMGHFNANFDSTFNGGDYHHRMNNLTIIANHCKNGGWDGLQASNAWLNCRIIYNLVEENAMTSTSGQNFSIVMNGGFSGRTNNNVCIREGMQCFPGGSLVSIFNNVIDGYNSQNGIYVRRTDNPMTVAPNGDSYVHNEPDTFLNVFQNLIISIQDPIYMADFDDAGSGIVPIYALNFVNNTLFFSSPVEGQFRYNEPGSSPPGVQINNYVAASISGIGLADRDNKDYDYSDSSSIPSQTTKGVDTSGAENFATDLGGVSIITDNTLKITDLFKTSFVTDINDMCAPLNGYFGFGHSPRRVKNHETLREPDITKSLKSWYTTTKEYGVDESWSNLQGPSDKVQLPECYSGKINRTAANNGLRIVGAERKIAKTGKRYGLEYFDLESKAL